MSNTAPLHPHEFAVYHTMLEFGLKNGLAPGYAIHDAEQAVIELRRFAQTGEPLSLEVGEPLKAPNPIECPETEQMDFDANNPPPVVMRTMSG